MAQWCCHEIAAVAAAVHGSAMVDTSSAACTVLFVGSVWPVYGAAAAWVSFKFVFVFQDSGICCQSASSVCIFIISVSVCQSVSSLAVSHGQDRDSAASVWQEQV